MGLYLGLDAGASLLLYFPFSAFSGSTRPLRRRCPHSPALARSGQLAHLPPPAARFIYSATCTSVPSYPTTFALPRATSPNPARPGSVIPHPPA